MPPTYNANTIDHIESHVKNKIIPELTQSVIKKLRSPEFNILNDYDWNDKDFHNSITQNLGNFMKEANNNFPRALKHSLAESSSPREDPSVQAITEQAIEYLAECIQVRLKKEVKDNDLYSKRFSPKDYKDIKRNFPKYITRDFSSYLTPWKQLIQEFLEKYEK